MVNKKIEIEINFLDNIEFNRILTYVRYVRRINMSGKEKANLKWEELSFGYTKTDFNIRFHYKDGAWSQGELSEDDTMNMHISAPCLHYGQEAFEGLKAFETKDKKIVVFRPDQNAKRMQKTCERLYMPQISDEMFLDAVQKVVKANERFVPPYGTGASLYIRPVIVGTGARIGLGPAEEYEFIMLVTPVGPYYKGGFKPVEALVVEQFDRAAPFGIGSIKAGANYAAGLAGDQYGKKKGFPVVLYLDSKEHKYIDELSTSNFISIKGDTYLTPKSDSILPSITNDSLGILAADIGLKYDKRPIPITELEELDEVGAVGTAAIITPVSKIHYGDKVYVFGDGENPGPNITKLYNRLRELQYGEYEDKHNWLFEIK
jgi:branched-chain amino acid aminotransferase